MFLNTKEFIISDLYVSSKDTYKKIDGIQKFHPEGLYSEQIFGNIDDWSCWCEDNNELKTNIIMNKKSFDRCPKCGVLYGPSLLRRIVFGKIKLRVPVLSGKAYLLINRIKNLKAIYNALIKEDKIVIIQKNVPGKPLLVNKYQINNLDNYNKEDNYIITDLTEFVNYIQEILSKKKNIEESKLLHGLKLLFDNNEIFTDEVLVLPPALRPISSDGKIDQLSVLYKKLLAIDDSLSGAISKYSDKGIFKKSLQNELEKIVLEIRTMIIEQLKGKDGILRGATGKRTDWSARCVIVPTSDEAYKIKIPLVTALEIYKLDLAKNLSDLNIPFITIIKQIEDMIKNRPVKESFRKRVIEEVNKLVQQDIFLVNRQPTLHRGSMWAVKAEIWDHYAMGLPKLLCEPLNADFDGDTMSILRVFNNKDEIWKNMSVYSKEAITNYQDFSCYLRAKQDTVYALYRLSKTEEGQKKLKEIFDGIDKYFPLTSKNIAKLFLEHNDVKLFDKLSKLADIETESKPITVGLIDYLDAEVKNKKLKNLKEDYYNFDTDEEYLEKSKLINEIEEEIKKTFIARDIIDSGARGSYTQLMQIVGARGYVTDYTDNIYRKFIKNNYLRGLNGYDMLISAKGTRKALLDQNTKMRQSGYLNRKLSFGNANAIVDFNKDFCGTKKTLKVFVPEDDNERDLLAKSLLYRKANVNDKIVTVTKELLDSLKGQYLNLYSPITCQHNLAFCRTCYPLPIDTPFVGIVAGQSITERTSQLTLRTKHTGGVSKITTQGSVKDVSNVLKKIINYFDATKEYNSLDELSDDMINIWKIFVDLAVIQLIHFEVTNAERFYALIQSNDQQKLVSRKTLFNNPLLKPLKYKLLGVKKLPLQKAKRLGLLYEDPIFAMINFYLEDINKEQLKETPLDRIYFISVGL